MVDGRPMSGDDGLVLDINGGELLVLGAVGVIVLGPERLPHYAAQLGSFIRQARSFARTARAQVREELGEDFDDIDWESLDPRRYDPRRIVREALLDDEDEPVLHQPHSDSTSDADGPDLTKRDAGTAAASSASPSGESTVGFDPDAT
jgi:sec-independent protein translocase protein TatB